MKIFKTTSLIIAFLAITFTSCKKDDPIVEVQKPLNSAVITITAPTTNQQFNQKSVVTFSGKIEATDDMHGYKLVASQKSDKKVHFTKEVHDHAKVYEFNETWINIVKGMQDMEFEVTAILDHDGKTTSQIVYFHCHGM